ncbi:gamma-interferon-inducible lysosomal thiol reductase-like [Dermacentor variabilis]|uniref:gamma-interferon-inducible lysosomal thiol reductase-like n=1 Tax=Dermacentor variabilis TaxID=34621 RepID=UPI003F5C3CA5
MKRARTGGSLSRVFAVLIFVWCASALVTGAPASATNDKRYESGSETDDNDQNAGSISGKNYNKAFVNVIETPEKNLTKTTTTTTTTRRPSISVVTVTKKVKVVVVYESHCPYSRRFMYSQLLPTYQKMNKFMNLTILPFGKARVDNVSAPVPHFTCQHGTNECMGNMIETCVVHVVKKQMIAVKILACMSESYQPHLAGQKCVEGTGVKWSKIQECVTNKGTRYLLEAGLETWKVQSYVARVPLVVVDGEMDNYVEYYAQKDLMKLMCEHLPYDDYRVSPCAAAGK